MRIVISSIVKLTRWSWLLIVILLAYRFLSSGLSTQSLNQSVQPTRFISSLGKTQQHDGLSSTIHSSSGEEWSTPELQEINRSISLLDEIYLQDLKEAKLQKANHADWLTLCRRLSLALVGSGLSLEEIRNLEQLPEEKREETHLRNLLLDSRHHHYWAQ